MLGTGAGAGLKFGFLRINLTVQRVSVYLTWYNIRGAVVEVVLPLWGVGSMSISSASEL